MTEHESSVHEGASGTARWPRLLIMAAALGAVVYVYFRVLQVKLRPDAPVLFFLVLTCIMQLLGRKIPLIAATVIGGIVVSVTALIDPAFNGRMRFQQINPADWFWLIAIGLVSGYIGGVMLRGLFDLATRFEREGRRQVYVVPRRFGVGTILLTTTVFAMFFALLQWANARPWELFFYTSFVATVAIAQMVSPKTPRWASVLAGGVFLPLSIYLFGIPGRHWFVPRHIPRDNLVTLSIAAVIGLLVGYLGGTLIAGLFLVCDYLVVLFSQRVKHVVNDAGVGEETMAGSSFSQLAERAAAARRASQG